VAQVDNRGNFAALDIGQRDVCEFPVVAARREPRSMQRRAVAQEGDADFLDAVEVFPPPAIMVRRGHLIDADRAVLDGRDAILDPGGENEIGDIGSPGGRRPG
jgi:hypothetical protein